MGKTINMKTIKITKEEIKTQTDAIKWHLKNYGHITSLEAIREYGATRLASIIFNLKKNPEIIIYPS